MQQNTQEWLDFRRNKIGASDAPIILGISPYRNATPYSLWEEKVFGKDREKTGAMRRGTLMEPQALAEFERQTRISVMPKVAVSKERPWQMASIDGISFDESIFVEIKCPGREDHESAVNGIIPDHYQTQMQHQMSVLDLPEGLYFSFDGKEGVVIPFKRDDLYIEEMLEQEEKFYECMMTQTAPDLCERDYIIRDDLIWNETAKEWLELSKYIKQLEESEEELRSKLIRLSEGQSTKGSGIRVTRSRPKGTIDYKSAATALGIDFEPYRKPSSERWTLAACK